MATNVNPETGIRYGIISMHNLESWVQDELDCHGKDLSYEEARREAEAQFENEAKILEMDEDERSDWVEEQLGKWGENYERDEPIIELRRDEGTDDELHVQTTWLGGAQLLFIFCSPHTGRHRLCSPCVPNCGDLDNPDGDGEVCYDVPPDWRRKEEDGEAEITPTRKIVIVLSSENENDDVKTVEDLFGFIQNELENANIGALMSIEKSE